MNKLKQKKILLVGIVALILIILFGGVLLLSSKKASVDNSTETTGIDQSVQTLSTKDFGLKVTLRPDKKALMFEITKPKGIKHIEYQITYTKELDGEQVPEGIFGEMNIAKDGITKTDYREFGTCSSGVCRYDKVVSDAKIVFKIDKDDGKSYSAEENVSLK